MLLRPNGVDIIYIDESGRYPRFLATAVRVPFLRPSDEGWRFVWHDHHRRADDWRRALSRAHGIKFRKEMHGHEILGRKGLYLRGDRNLGVRESVQLYRDALHSLTFLEAGSVITTYAGDGRTVGGADGIEACMVGLFQRLRTQCSVNDVNALVFFDEGHDEYIRWFRRAQVHLPTGSMFGGWQDGRATRNIPFDLSPEDGNIKRSVLSYHMQIADLIVYAARLKIEDEDGALAAKRQARGHGTLYDAVPTAVLNLRSTRKRNDAIVPL